MTIGRLLIVFVLVAALIPDAAEAQSDLIARAKRLDAEGQQEPAIALYRQALAKTAASFDAHYGLARALDLHGDYGEARDHFTKAIELAPDDGSRDQATRMLGVSWTFVANARQATVAFQRVFERRAAAGDFAGAAEVGNELGRVLLELGDADAATRWYRKGYDSALGQPSRTAADTTLAELRWAHAQARIAIRLGRLPETRRQVTHFKALLERGTNRDQQSQLRYLTGYVAFYAKDYQGAITALRQADQEDPFILLLLAQASERLGRKAEAHAYYDRVMTSNSHAVNNAFARPVARRWLAQSR